MTDSDVTRDAEDVERPSEIFPSITTPTEPKRHARQHRGVDVLPSSSFRSGRFGRMFRNLPVFELPSLDLLTPLAKKMVPSGGGAPIDNPDIPSGYTYLGQFIDHDITFDPVSSLQRQNDPDALHKLPHASVRPRLTVWPRTVRPAVSVRRCQAAARRK